MNVSCQNGAKSFDTVLLKAKSGLVPFRAQCTGGTRLRPETQKLVLDAAASVFSAIGRALGVESPGSEYEQSIQFLKKYGVKTLFELLAEFLPRVAPLVGSEHTISPDMFRAFLEAMETREKAELILAGLPEPNPQLLTRIITEVKLFLPRARPLLSGFAAELPHHPGGRKRVFQSPEDEREARAEVVTFMIDHGLSFSEAKKRIARKRQVSLSSIQRLFRGQKHLEKEPLQE